MLLCCTSILKLSRYEQLIRFTETKMIINEYQFFKQQFPTPSNHMISNVIFTLKKIKG